MSSSLESAENKVDDWTDVVKNREKTIDKGILEVADESWRTAKTIYHKYTRVNNDDLTYQTFLQRLTELEKIGELNSRTKQSETEFKVEDKPIQETREDHSSALSEGLPDYLEDRIQKEIAQQVEAEINKIRDDLGPRVKIQRINLADNSTGDSKNLEADLEKLNYRQKEVYSILREEGELSAAEIGDKYRERTQHDVSDRTIRRYIKHLVDREMVEKNGCKRGSTYEVNENAEV